MALDPVTLTQRTQLLLLWLGVVVVGQEGNFPAGEARARLLMDSGGSRVYTNAVET